MNIFALCITIFGPLTIFSSCCAPTHSEDRDDGEKYAQFRIIIDGEREWSKSTAHQGIYHTPKSLPNHPTFDDLDNMITCVHSYVKEGNVSGIRGAFLMAYIAASIPHRSGDIISSYSEPLYELRDCLGDKKFASSLSKMRPEVQAAVFYVLFINHWPAPGSEKEWDDKFKSKYPMTFILNNNVKRLKWPHDYEKRLWGQSKITDIDRG